MCGATEEFLMEVSVYQVSALSPYLFVFIMDELTRVPDEVPRHMIFGNDEL